RALTGACDAAELCSGASAACPANSFAADTTACNDGTFCNGADHCSSGACSAHAGNPCTAECARTCNETSDSCLDAAQTPCTSDGNPCTDDVCDSAGHCGIDNAVACDDGNPCTSDDRCSGGACIGGGPPPECDDGNPCTVDSCDPVSGCSSTDRSAYAVSGHCSKVARSKLKIFDDGNSSSIKLQLGPEAIDIDYAGLGAPDVDTTYGMCIYDTTGF